MRNTDRSKKVKKVADLTIRKEMKSYENDPVFVKKNEEAEAFLKKYGLPAELTKAGNR